MTIYGPYPARVLDWHDGDLGTCHIDVDLGFAQRVSAYSLDGKPQMSMRVWGIDAPELSDPTGSGKAARAYAIGLCPEGTLVTLESYEWGKYGGRFLGSITLADGRDFGAAMIEAGHATAYFGGAKVTPS